MRYKNNSSINRRIKNVLSEHIKGCFYCGDESNKEVCLDHFIPKSKGGSDHISNLMNCCRSCNSSKSNKTLDQFRASTMCKKSRFSGVVTGAQILALEKLGVYIPTPGHLFHFEVVGYVPLETLSGFGGDQ